LLVVVLCIVSLLNVVVQIYFFRSKRAKISLKGFEHSVFLDLAPMEAASFFLLFLQGKDKADSGIMLLKKNQKKRTN